MATTNGVPESITAIPMIPGLTVDEQATMGYLANQLMFKAGRNELRASYYDGRNAVRDLGISTPPNFRRIATVLGWSAKAVDILNRRCKLEGFDVPGLNAADFGWDELWHANRLAAEAPQAGVSSLIHATAFLVTTLGDTQSGEPPVLITARDALSGTGDWDPRRRALRSFLSIFERDDRGVPIDLALYVDGLTVTARKDQGRWTVDRRSHKFGLPVEPLVYQPRLARPFGSSRISRAVMSLHDQALRTVIRSEVTAEIYSAPQRVLLGADESAFKNADGTFKSTWQAVLGRVWAIPDDDEAANPRAEIKEFTGASQQPHVDQLRAWAQLFAGETSIPLASLGISGDANPTSADAYESGRDDLLSEAEGTTDGWSPAWERTFQRGLQMLNNWSDDGVPKEIQRSHARWRDVRTPTRAAAADAAAKTIAAFPWLAETELGLELYGFDQSFIDRAMVEKRRVGASAALRRVAAAAQANQVPAAAPVTDVAAADATPAG
jgi:hypothetical protein